MTDKQRQNLELVKPGFANGISTQLANKQAIEGPDARLTEEEKQHIITNGSNPAGGNYSGLQCIHPYGEWIRKCDGYTFTDNPGSDSGSM